VIQSDRLGLLKFFVLDTFQPELCLDSKKIWANGWLDSCSHMKINLLNGRLHPALHGSKESVSQFHFVAISCLIIGHSWYRKECTKVICIATTHMMCR
jgi:hypothetical protein